MKASIRFLFTLIFCAAGIVSVRAQSLTAQEQAYLALEDLVAATPALKLPQNRSRLQIVAADLLWKRDEARARSVFSDAAANILELQKQTRRGREAELDQSQSPAHLRQELVLTAARHDPALAYDLFQRTRQQKAKPEGRVPEDETYLEQLLLTQVATTDPDFALRKAAAMLERGEYSVAIVSILEKVQEPRTPELPAATRQLLETVDARVRAVRQKIGEPSDRNKTRLGMGQLTYLTPQGTSNNLLTAAASAPSEVRKQLYQQAALKALDEGSADRARQIANDHLDTNMRSAVFQRIAAEQQVRKGKSTQLEEMRQSLETVPDRDRVGLLLQLAETTKTDNPKQSRQFLDEALALVTQPATNYKQVEDQLQVAHVLSEIEPDRSLALLESGINKLNELLSAAASLSGFEVQIFKPAEMPLPGESRLGAMVIRYGQELAIVAKSDFRRALAAADQFQYQESRLFARLTIIQAVLAAE